jgi:hypothetical protein
MICHRPSRNRPSFPSVGIKVFVVRRHGHAAAENRELHGTDDAELEALLILSLGRPTISPDEIFKTTSNESCVIHFEPKFNCHMDYASHVS